MKDLHDPQYLVVQPHLFLFYFQRFYFQRFYLWFYFFTNIGALAAYGVGFMQTEMTGARLYFCSFFVSLGFSIICLILLIIGINLSKLDMIMSFFKLHNMLHTAIIGFIVVDKLNLMIDFMKEHIDPSIPKLSTYCDDQYHFNNFRFTNLKC